MRLPYLVYWFICDWLVFIYISISICPSTNIFISRKYLTSSPSTYNSSTKCWTCSPSTSNCISAK